MEFPNFHQSALLDVYAQLALFFLRGEGGISYNFVENKGSFLYISET